MRLARLTCNAIIAILIGVLTTGPHTWSSPMANQSPINIISEFAQKLSIREMVTWNHYDDLPMGIIIENNGNTDFCYALRDVRVKVPHAVRRGERATLKCYYDIEDDSLYSVKWYKGRREFYRYTPKENPAMKIFQFPGVKVSRFASNESHLVLESVTMATTGKYSCEVSADAPSFHTLIAAGELEVAEVPHSPPIISGIRGRYRVGDILRGNCTSRHSRPAANLTWTVNDEEVRPSHVRHHKVMRDTRTDLETTIAGIHFLVTEQHFENGKLKLRCEAQVHDIYWKSTEKTILAADYHHKYAGTHSSNAVPTDKESPPPLSPPYDQYALHDGEMLHKKRSYLTRLQDFLYHLLPSSSSSSSSSATADEYDDDGEEVEPWLDALDGTWTAAGAATRCGDSAPRCRDLLIAGSFCWLLMGRLFALARRTTRRATLRCGAS